MLTPGQSVAKKGGSVFRRPSVAGGAVATDDVLSSGFNWLMGSRIPHLRSKAGPKLLARLRSALSAKSTSVFGSLTFLLLLTMLDRRWTPPQ